MKQAATQEMAAFVFFCPYRRAYRTRRGSLETAMLSRWMTSS